MGDIVFDDHQIRFYRSQIDVERHAEIDFDLYSRRCAFISQVLERFQYGLQRQDAVNDDHQLCFPA